MPKSSIASPTPRSLSRLKSSRFSSVFSISTLSVISSTRQDGVETGLGEHAGDDVVEAAG